MGFSGTVAIRAMKAGDYQATIFAGTDAGLVSALGYAGTKGLVVVGPGDMTTTSTFTIQDGTELRLSPGTITVDSGGFSVGNGSILRGSGYNSSRIVAGAAFSGTALVANTYALVGGIAPQSCMIYDLEVAGTKATATGTYGIYIKGVGQPSVIRDVMVGGCPGVGIQIEGITTNAASMCMLDNIWVNGCNGHNIVVTGPMGAVSMSRISTETIPANKAGIYIDGTASSTDQGGIWIRDVHIESLAANAIGILLEDSRDVTVDNVLYYGAGGNGDLVKITGLAADSYNITCRNLYVKFNATATTVNDVTNSVSLTNEVPYYATGPMRILGAITADSTLDLTGVLTARAATANFGTAGTAHTTTIGQGGSGTAQSDLVINSGSSGATQARWLLERNAQADLLGLANGTIEQLQFRHALQFSTTAGAAAGYMTTAGKLRLGDGNIPVQGIEVVGSPLFTALTSGKYPKISTGGLIIDGPTPLAGTKIYYVSDTSGGAVTRKLTFIDGILTAET